MSEKGQLWIKITLTLFLQQTPFSPHWSHYAIDSVPSESNKCLNGITRSKFRPSAELNLKTLVPSSQNWLRRSKLHLCKIFQNGCHSSQHVSGIFLTINEALSPKYFCTCNPINHFANSGISCMTFCCILNITHKYNSKQMQMYLNCNAIITLMLGFKAADCIRSDIA